VAQDEGPEFKPQYHKKEKEKKIPFTKYSWWSGSRCRP
jgi:hypothetical protein